MAQQNYTGGVTSFTLDNLITRAKKQNLQFNTGSPDFLGAAQWVLANYAGNYAGDFYTVPSQASAPTAFPAAQSALTAGSFYEISYPADCRDTGILAIEILWDTSNLKSIDQALINRAQDETTWDTTSSNTTKVYWRSAGRKIRIYVPAAYVAVAPKYALTYGRLPTFPGLVSDTLDVPAEDIDTFYATWLAAIVQD